MHTAELHACHRYGFLEMERFAAVAAASCPHAAAIHQDDDLARHFGHSPSSDMREEALLDEAFSICKYVEPVGIN